MRLSLRKRDDFAALARGNDRVPVGLVEAPREFGGVLGEVNHGEDHDHVGLNGLEDGVGEPPEQGAAEMAMSRRMAFGKMGDLPDDLVGFVEKLSA